MARHLIGLAIGLLAGKEASQVGGRRRDSGVHEEQKIERTLVNKRSLKKIQWTASWRRFSFGKLYLSDR